ncbi:hypothetical protein OPW33_24630 [Vibrio europaeus]|uniref:hypothetical protein n=1 Tax=Vibrio europaeus TaxID=300876 RepID=UPI002341CC40|nr:hypothetical protein [Vibrio europaeus]MDC5842516.1 hypothetical protein [Vibrio europaeus]
MDYQKIISLIAQKGFSGSAGIVGLKIILSADFQTEGWIGAGVVGCFLITLAVVIEYLVWKEGNRFINDRIKVLESEKRKVDSRIEKFEGAMLERLTEPMTNR